MPSFTSPFIITVCFFIKSGAPFDYIIYSFRPFLYYDLYNFLIA